MLLEDEDGVKCLSESSSTHSGVRKYCLALRGLALGPDHLDLILGASAF